MTCEEVMTSNPRFCTNTTTAQTAALLMAELNVGIIPVVDEDAETLVGVVTDRDLCLTVVAEGQDPTVTTVRECMTENPITCRPTDDISVAMDRMKQYQIRRIPIVDSEGACIGIIAQGDVAMKVDEPKAVHAVVREISREDGTAGGPQKRAPR